MARALTLTGSTFTGVGIVDNDRLQMRAGQHGQAGTGCAGRTTRGVMMKSSEQVIALAALLLASCNSNGAATAEQATAIADQYWKDKLPQTDLRRLEKKTEDFGDRWRVTYAVPGGSTGGPWSLDVDKKTGKIVGGSGGQ